MCNYLHIGVKMRSIKVALLATLCAIFSGCASTNYSKNPNPATITEYWLRSGAATWEGVKVFRVNEVEYGYIHDNNGETYTTDHGPTEIQVWYIGKESTDSLRDMPKQTDLADLKTNLEPNGQYQIAISKIDGFIKIDLVDTKSNAVVASTPMLKTVRRSMVTNSFTVMPIQTPAK